jgi:molecular chaperone GrpE (heat shock protein)
MTLDDRPLAAPLEGRRAGRNLLSRLARRFGLAPIPADVAEHLAELQTTVAALTQAQADNQQALSGLRETMEKTEKQLARLGKEQFKANLLAETQRQNTKELLDEIREAEKQHERELAELRERLSRARAEGRLEIVKSALPALDGLDEALAAGERMLAAPAHSPAPASTAFGSTQDAPRGSRLTFGQRLNAAMSLLFASSEAEPRPALSAETLPREAVVSWLQGLDFIQERLLSILAAEGVYPIETEDAPFDPHQHVAVESVPATGGLAPGRVVRELRRGYRRSDGAVLRYAEVVVARDTPENQRES